MYVGYVHEREEGEVGEVGQWPMSSSELRVSAMRGVMVVSLRWIGKDDLVVNLVKYRNY